MPHEGRERSGREECVYEHRYEWGVCVCAAGCGSCAALNHGRLQVGVQRPSERTKLETRSKARRKEKELEMGPMRRGILHLSSRAIFVQFHAVFREL
jgi:hypothetical protein